MVAGQESVAVGDIEVRVLSEHKEFHETLSVQSGVWRFSEVDQVPPRILSVSKYIGGLVLGAYEDARMIGFSLSFPGMKRGGATYWHSHMTGVLDGYQNRGIGYKIKLKQREEAIRCGVDLVEWFFDPLQIRNAHFNIEKLGGVVRSFLPNQYGITSSPLHGGLPTDRLVIEWNVTSMRVATVVAGGEITDRRIEQTIRIPASIDDWRANDPEQARSLQTRVRGEFQKHFGEGLVVIGYERTDEGGVFQLGRL
jgi:predicted GNAT superfamily acetyltransferase